MAERSGFFDAYIVGDAYDREYEAAHFAEYFARFIGNGVFINPSTNCQIIANNNMTVTLKAGAAYINGYIYVNESDLTFNITPADGVANRIDRVVIQYDISGRIISASVKEGLFSATPVPKTLQRDADVYELGIADIYISAGATNITQANITDLRLNSDYCGIVAALFDQPDMTTIFNQYQTWLNETQASVSGELASTISELRGAFNIFFNDIKNTLSGDVAGNLYNMIVANTELINALDIRLDKAEYKLFTSTISTTWAGSEAPFTQQKTLSAIVTGNEVVRVSCPSSATVDQLEAYDALRLKDGGQTVGSFTLKAIGEKNLIEIPVIIAIVGG